MELVNHPSHYNIECRKECIEELADDYGQTIARIFCLTNAYKYLYRAGYKEGNTKEQDISKARWYYNKAMSYTDCDYVFAVQDLRDKIQKELDKYE